MIQTIEIKMRNYTTGGKNRGTLQRTTDIYEEGLLAPLYRSESRWNRCPVEYSIVTLTKHEQRIGERGEREA